MSAAQMRNPVKRGNADGAEKHDFFEEDRMPTVSQTRPPTVNPAFVAGYVEYPFTHETGRHAAQLWHSGDPAMSLADFRDSRWKAYSCGRQYDPAERVAFNEGFSVALAEHIAGVSHG